MKHINIEVIETREQIRDLVNDLFSCTAPSSPNSPILYIDLEGINLCREGTVSILTLLVHQNNLSQRIYLIDVYTLGAKAFTTVGAQDKTLKDILQDDQWPKIFFDVRNDSDALFAHFGVALDGVEDVQLMESAARKTTSSRRLLNGLSKCVESRIVGNGLVGWKMAKQKGERLFKPEHGGSSNVFNTRPISDDIIQYCAGDVQYLPKLRNCFSARDNTKRELVKRETKARVAASQQPDYQPYGQQKALAPWDQQQNAILDRLNYASHRDNLNDPFDTYDNWSDTYDDPWDDCGPTSSRDCIPDSDYHFYYDD